MKGDYNYFAIYDNVYDDNLVFIKTIRKKEIKIYMLSRYAIKNAYDNFISCITNRVTLSLKSARE